MLRRGAKCARLLLLVSSIAACSDDGSGDDRNGPDGGDAGQAPGVSQDAGSDANVGRDIDAANDGGNVVSSDASSNKPLAACLEQQGLARPPGVELPCELLPPGLTLAR
jgi:hypothetical protein